MHPYPLPQKLLLHQIHSVCKQSLFTSASIMLPVPEIPCTHISSTLSVCLCLIQQQSVCKLCLLQHQSCCLSQNSHTYTPVPVSIMLPVPELPYIYTSSSLNHAACPRTPIHIHQFQSQSCCLSQNSHTYTPVPVSIMLPVPELPYIYTSSSLNHAACPRTPIHIHQFQSVNNLCLLL